ncbi:MAG: tetratricopeptide repeat protein [Saprospiraceae bacterium]|nr:tetratricopeptide repeat protein [Saprospiraceae bacterium]
MSKKNKKPNPSAPNPIVDKTIKSSLSAQSASEKPTFWQNTRLQAVVIFALSFLLYANTLSHDFCQDDSIVITENMFTTEGVAGIKGILSYDTFYGFFKEAGKAQLVAGGRYRPFTLIMFAIEYQIFGKNPFIGHFINVVLFGLTCVLLYFLLLKLLTYRQNDETSDMFGVRPTLVAFMAAILFAAHPIHTEAVANIKGRDEIMTLLGSLAAVWFSLKAFENQGIKNAILAFIFFFVALLSKENAITFVVITPLIYWFFLKSDVSTAIKQTIPFAASAILFILLRGAVIGNQFGGEQMELMNNPFLKLVGNQYVPFSFAEKFATITYTLGKYIQLLIVPHPLTHDYYPRHIGIMSFGDWQVLLSIAVYIALFALILRGWQKRSLVSFGLAFFLITLSIVSNIVFPVGTNMAERFMFMPSIGFCLVLAILLAKLGLKRHTENGQQLAIMVSLVITALFGLKTIMRNPAWKDNYTIFTTDIEYSPNSAKLQTSVGGETIEHFKNSTNEAEKKAKITEAIGHLQKALEIHPPFKNPYLLMGNGYFYLQDFDKAIASYSKALELDPQFKDAQVNLSLVYREGGKIIGQEQKNLPKAIEYLSKAVELNPNDAAALSFLGTAYGMSNLPQKSVEVLTKALNIRFDKQDAINISVAYRQLGDVTKAMEYEKMVQGK